MLDGTYTELAELTELAEGVQGREEGIRLLAILFMRKEQEITYKSIVPTLSYFDKESGNDLHFILAGWRRTLVVADLGHSNTESWEYDEDAFLFAKNVISEATNWKYSGGVDLLLVTTNTTSKSFVIDFSGAISLELTRMITDHLVPSHEILLHNLISFARSYRGNDPLLGIAVQEARVSAFKAIMKSIAGFLLSKEAIKEIDYASQFEIRDVSKPNPPSDVSIVLHHERNLSP
jgi:hypothetical protein